MKVGRIEREIAVGMTQQVTPILAITACGIGDNLGCHLQRSV